MPIPRPIVAVPANLIREGGRGGEGGCEPTARRVCKRPWGAPVHVHAIIVTPLSHSLWVHLSV